MEEQPNKKNEQGSKRKKIERKAKPKKIKASTLFFSFIVLVFSYFIFLSILIYAFNVRNYFIEKNERFFPFPATLVGKSFIPISAMNERLKAVKNFYQNQNFSEIGFRIDFSTPEGKNRLKIKEKDVLNKLIEDKIVLQAANERGIFISKEMIDEEVEKKIKEYENLEQLTSNLHKLYNWSIDDFKENIVKPDMYKKALQLKIIAEDPEITKAEDKISQAKSELDNRADFKDVAEKYSEGESAKNSGDLGWFSSDQMLPELSQASFSMKKGEISEIIASSIGFHIIQVVDTKEEDDKKMVKVRQIFVRTKTFSEWLVEEEKGKNIIIFLKDYKWNQGSSFVEFKSQDLTNFERNLKNNSPDDISVMF